MTAESNPSFPARLLPDAIRQRVAPGAVVLRLATTRTRQGILDGAWWPRSRAIGTQLPGLVTALTEYLGPIVRVGLDAEAWDEVPGHLIIDGRVVPIDWFPIGDDTVLITRGERDHFLLLVIPPQATPAAAHAAMATAVHADNDESAQQILLTTGITSAPEGTA